MTIEPAVVDPKVPSGRLHFAGELPLPQSVSEECAGTTARVAATYKSSQSKIGHILRPAGSNKQILIITD